MRLHVANLTSQLRKWVTLDPKAKQHAISTARQLLLPPTAADDSPPLPPSDVIGVVQGLASNRFTRRDPLLGDAFAHLARLPAPSAFDTHPALPKLVWAAGRALSGAPAGGARAARAGGGEGDGEGEWEGDGEGEGEGEGQGQWERGGGGGDSARQALRLLRRFEPALRTRARDMAPNDIALVTWALARSGERGTLWQALLHEVTQRRVNEFSPRDVAMLVRAVATDTPGVSKRVLGALAPVVTNRAPQFTDRMLASVAWSYATAGVGNKAVFGAITRAVLPLHPRVHGQTVSNLLWAFAKVGAPALRRLLESVALLPPDRFRSFSSQSVSNIVWVAATHGGDFKHADALLANVCARAGALLGDLTPQGIANVVWGLAKCGKEDEQLLAGARARVVTTPQSFSDQALANVVWAFGKFGRRDDDLFRAVLGEASVRLARTTGPSRRPSRRADAAHAPGGGGGGGGGDGDPNGASPSHSATTAATTSSSSSSSSSGVGGGKGNQHGHGFNLYALAQILWACTEVGVMDRAFVERTVLPHLSAHRLRSAQTRTVVAITVAMVKLGAEDAGLLQRVVDALRPAVPRFTPHMASNTLWALGKGAFVPHTDFVAVLAHDACAARADEFSPHQLSNAVWGVVKMRVRAEELLQVAAGRVAREPGEFSPQGLATVVWALALARIDRPDAFRSVARDALGRLRGFNNQDLALVAWAFTMAGHHDDGLVDAVLGMDWRARGMRPEVQSQLYLSDLTHRLAHPGGTTLPPAVARQCRQGLRALGVRLSEFQLDVASTLRRLGVRHVNELQTDEGLTIDVALVEHGKVALEMDGPHHYWRGTDVVLGSTARKRWLLTSLGWTVVPITHTAWTSLQSPEDKEVFLVDTLRERASFVV